MRLLALLLLTGCSSVVWHGQHEAPQPRTTRALAIGSGDLDELARADGWLVGALDTRDVHTPGGRTQREAALRGATHVVCGIDTGDRRFGPTPELLVPFTRDEQVRLGKGVCHALRVEFEAQQQLPERLRSRGPR